MFKKACYETFIKNTDIILKQSLPPFVLYLFDPPTLTEGGESKNMCSLRSQNIVLPTFKP